MRRNPPILRLVVEADLAKPQESLSIDARYGGVWALVTYDGIPLCTFELDRDPGAETIAAEEFRREVLEKSSWMAWQQTVGQRFERTNPPLPMISVVICTRDRASLLERCLDSLKQIDYPGYEVVVVDNGSTDPRVRHVIEGAGVRYVLEKRPGLDWARNRGAQEARYDIISYIDDDAVASRGWLRGMARGFQDRSVMAVTGLVFPAELDTEPQVLFERYGGMSKGIKSRSFNIATLPPRAVLAVHNFGVGANMAFRREVFERIGGFDTMLDVGTPSAGAGDLDMFHRTLAEGLTLRYEPTALIWHRHRRSHADLRRQIYANGRSYGVYLIKTWRAGRTRGTMRYAAGWMSGWVVRRYVRGMLGREDFPSDLLWAELRGALTAPLAYQAALKHDRRIRQANSS